MPVSDLWGRRVLKVAKACVETCSELLTQTDGEAAAALENLKTLLKDDVGTLKILQTGLTVLSAILKEGIKAEFQEDKTVELVGMKAWLFRMKSYALIWICKDLGEYCKQADDAASEAVSVLILARIHMTRADQPDAPAAVIKTANNAIKLFQALGNAAGEAEALALLMDGSTLLATVSPFKEVQEKSLDQALEAGSSALQLCKSAGSAAVEVKVQCSLANAHMGFQGDREHLNAAEAAAEEAVSVARKAKMIDLEVMGVEALMRVRIRLEGPSEGERIANEAARRWKRAGNKGSEAWARKKSLEACIAMGEYENAQNRCAELISLLAQVGDTKGGGDTYKLLSQCYAARKEMQEAIDSLRDASEMYHKCGDKRAEALTLLSIIDLSTQGMSIEVLADCYTQRDETDKFYNVENAEEFRKGDEAVRMCEQVKSIFKEIGDEGGQQYVDQLLQANMDSATETYTQQKDPDVEAVKVNPVDWKTESKICIWNVTMPRMMAKANTDTQKEEAVFRVQRER